MDDRDEAQASWDRSAAGWIEAVERGDVNRTHLLDAPMLRLTRDVVGRAALDVGCGEGRFCRMLAARGARATGLDPTVPLVARARALDPVGTYVVGSAEALPFGNATFDLVITYLTLINIPDHRAAITEMARVLRPGGRLLVANLQSFATTFPSPWQRDADGQKTHFAVDDYFPERPNRAAWGGISILNWHRPMQSYMAAYLEAGLILRAFEEPCPTPEAVAEFPSMRDEARVPLFHVMAWDRPS